MGKRSRFDYVGLYCLYFIVFLFLGIIFLPIFFDRPFRSSLHNPLQENDVSQSFKALIANSIYVLSQRCQLWTNSSTFLYNPSVLEISSTTTIIRIINTSPISCQVVPVHSVLQDLSVVKLQVNRTYPDLQIVTENNATCQSWNQNSILCFIKMGGYVDFQLLQTDIVCFNQYLNGPFFTVRPFGVTDSCKLPLE